MKKPFLFYILTLVFVLAAFSTPASSSGLQVKLDVQELARHSVLVTISWTVTVQSESDWEGCELLILFLDDQGREIHRISDVLSVKKGHGEFTGHEICQASIWDKTRRFSGRLNCGL